MTFIHTIVFWGFLFASLLYGNEVQSTCTLEKEAYSAAVGETVTMNFLLPKETVPFEAIQESLSRDAFFSKDNGTGRLLSVLPNENNHTLQVSFIPTCQDEGIALFAPIERDGKILYWSGWSYSFFLPKPPTFSYPLIDSSFTPIARTVRPLILKEMQTIIADQQKIFERREKIRSLFWSILLVGSFLIISFPFIRNVFHSWRKKSAAFFVQKKLQNDLERAIQEQKPNWALLLYQLVLLHEKKYGIKKETALELMLSFQEKDNLPLADVAMLIQNYGYLPEECFEKFSEAYSLLHRFRA